MNEYCIYLVWFKVLHHLPGVDVVEVPEQELHVHRHQAGLQRHISHGLHKDLCKSFLSKYKKLAVIAIKNFDTSIRRYKCLFNRKGDEEAWDGWKPWGGLSALQESQPWPGSFLLQPTAVYQDLGRLESCTGQLYRLSCVVSAWFIAETQTYTLDPDEPSDQDSELDPDKDPGQNQDQDWNQDWQ